MRVRQRTRLVSIVCTSLALAAAAAYPAAAAVKADQRQLRS
ncbi:hypothetical protein ACFXKC_46780 [Streptomyces sp. NPDC059340]